MNARKMLFVLPLAALAVMAGLQSCGRGQANTFGAVTMPCDGSSREFRYRGTGPGTTIIVRVLSYCTGDTIEYEDSRGIFHKLEDRLPDGGFGPISPLEGYAYAVTIPNGRRLRLTCAPGGSPQDSCRFELIDATQQPSSAHGIVDTLTIGCGDWHSAGFFNYSSLPIRVRVHWIDVCKNRGPHNRQIPQAPNVRLRVLGRTPATVSPGTATLSGNEANWRGPVTQNSELQVECPGTIAGCRFTVSFIR